MDIKKHLLDMLPNAKWDLLKYALLMAGPSMSTAFVGIVQRVKEGELDWWILGSVFVVSSVVMWWAIAVNREQVKFDSESNVADQSSPLKSKVGLQFLYGFMTATFLFALFFFALGMPVPVPSREEERFQYLGQHPPLWFTEDQFSRLQWDFLSLPRPCIFKITAPLEHVPLRGDLRELASLSFVNRLGRRNEFIIEPCKVISDRMDDDPKLYMDQVNYPPSGFIEVSAAPSNSEAAKFLIEALQKRAGLSLVRPGTELPSGSLENLIHIKIGTGAPVRY